MVSSANEKKRKPKEFVVCMTPEDLEILRRATAVSDEFFTHDTFVYVIWSILSFARSFFRRFLPPEILQNVKLETLRRFPTKMVDQDGKKTEGDLFYLVDTIDGEGMTLVIMLEHKSGSARNVALQTLGYEVDMMKQLTREPELFKNVEGRYPAPFTVVLAQYDAPQLDEIFYWVKGTRQYGPHFKFHLVNLQKENFDDVLDDEPMLYVAMALSRFVYRLTNRKRDSKWLDANYQEIVDIFSIVCDRDPTRSENYRFFLEVLVRYTSWFTQHSGFSFKRLTEEVMQKIEPRNKKPFQSFISQLLGEDLPQAYKELEARCNDYHTQVARQNEQLAQKSEQLAQKSEQLANKNKRIAQLDSSVKASSLQRSILLDANDRFKVPLPGSLIQRLFSITKIAVLSQIYELLQTRSSLEDFEREFDRLAVGY